ncbi:MAG TPA: peptidoglycan bridge formation glycyltransferase FemA/FemB family protein [Candidatus Andersenbacteria bacterium]|nr:peptidoglycan bridge formation glycyltransferase FemA/FemB family protein [Candidatus Andersenbacteria bacterium]
MQCKEIVNQQEWDDFVLAQLPNTFLQSWQWKRVQEQDGERVAMLGFYENNALCAVALLITVHAKRGNYYLCPHGPILKNTKDVKQVLELLKEYCLQCKSSDRTVVFRIAPLAENNKENQKLFRELHFHEAPMHVHAELTWVLDCSKQEDILLREMRKTTRHAITKAEKEGVEVEIIPDVSALERFWPLYEQTTNRHGFVAFQKKFMQSQAEIFGQSDSMFFVIAKYANKDIAGAMCMQFGNTVFYYHGASIKTSVPAAQLVQWSAIQEAKKRGATRYNFWGIAPEHEKNHPFAGITVFKKGFGGYAIDYMHAQDFPLSLRYWLMWFIEMLRKKKRGF